MVDLPEVVAEVQDGHAPLERPRPERGGNERQRHADAHAALEEAEGVVLAGAELVVLAEAETDGQRHRQRDRIRPAGIERVSGRDAGLQEHAAMAAGIRLAVELERDQHARVQGEGPQQLAVVVAEAERDFLHRAEPVVRAHVRGVDHG